MTQVTGKIEAELIEVCAYFKWLERCERVGYDQHGLDQHDWFEAERELTQLFRRLGSDDWDEISIITSQSLPINRKNVEKRAYFKWKQRSSNAGSETLAQSSFNDWVEALQEEVRLAFARLFLSAFPGHEHRLRLFTGDLARTG